MSFKILPLFLISASEFEERYFNHPDYNVAMKSYDFVSYQCYDHIWIAALALNCTAEKLTAAGSFTILLCHHKGLLKSKPLTTYHADFVKY